jgi:hypothetical protein
MGKSNRKKRTHWDKPRRKKSNPYDRKKVKRERHKETDHYQSDN